MGADDDKSLIAHAKKDRSKRDDHPQKRPKIFQNNHRSQRDYSSIRCYACDEKCRFATYFPKTKTSTRTNKKKRHHPHTVEYDEPTNKRTRKYYASDEQYVLILALTGTVTHGSNDWLVDSGASKHMTQYKKYFINLSKHVSPHKVKLGDYYQYPIKGSGESSFRLDSGKSMKIKDVICIPILNKNILSIKDCIFHLLIAKYSCVQEVVQ